MLIKNALRGLILKTISVRCSNHYSLSDYTKSDIYTDIQLVTGETILKLATKREYIAQRCYCSLFKFIGGMQKILTNQIKYKNRKSGMRTEATMEELKNYMNRLQGFRN